ncbi:hypothetical protein D3C79_931370 [compost metagenome]
MKQKARNRGPSCIPANPQVAEAATSPWRMFAASRTKQRAAWNSASMVKVSAAGIRNIALCSPTALKVSFISLAPAAAIATWE